MTMAVLIADIASWALIIIGSAGLVIGAIGVLRLPDVYTRMHAASITDTLGAGALLLVAAFIEAFWSPLNAPPALKCSVGGALWVMLGVYFTLAGRNDAA